MSIFLVLFFMGLVQGLTEFLPVSSSGHLVLLSNIFGVEESLFLSILLHVATLFSICAVFYKDIFALIRHPFSQKSIMIVTATIPTAVIALILMPFIKSSFGGTFLPVAFLFTAIILVAGELFQVKKREFSIKTAFIMGVMQGFAVFPGISRSGATISAGLMAGADKKECAKFSFLMSIPIIILSMFLEVYEAISGGISIDYPLSAIIISFLTAFVSGIFAIKFMMKFASGKYWWFSIYLILLSLATFFVG